MKARLVVFLGLMLGCLSTTQAEVVIYRGTVRTKSDIVTANSVPALTRLVLVVNYDTREVGTVVISKKPGPKKYQANVSLTLGVATAALKGGRSATMLVGGTASPPQPDTFNHLLISFRGTNATIKIRRAPSVVRTNRPKAITGALVSLSANAGVGRFAEQAVGTIFQEAETIKANDAGKTIADVIADISADLESKGYTPF